jgi:hypothetical protein
MWDLCSKAEVGDWSLEVGRKSFWHAKITNVLPQAGL